MSGAEPGSQPREQDPRSPEVTAQRQCCARGECGSTSLPCPPQSSPRLPLGTPRPTNVPRASDFTWRPVSSSQHGLPRDVGGTSPPRGLGPGPRVELEVCAQVMMKAALPAAMTGLGTWTAGSSQPGCDLQRRHYPRAFVPGGESAELSPASVLGSRSPRGCAFQALRAPGREAAPLAPGQAVRSRAHGREPGPERLGTAAETETAEASPGRLSIFFFWGNQWIFMAGSRLSFPESCVSFPLHSPLLLPAFPPSSEFLCHPELDARVAHPLSHCGAQGPWRWGAQGGGYGSGFGDGPRLRLSCNLRPPGDPGR